MVFFRAKIEACHEHLHTSFGITVICARIISRCHQKSQNGAVWSRLTRQPLPSNCYFCAIAKDRVWSDSTGFVSYAGMLAGQSDYRNRCLWLMNPFACGHKVENILLFAYCSLQTPQTSWKCVGTAERKDQSTHSRKHLTNVFSSEGTSVKGVVATLYLFIILKMSPDHDIHQRMLS